MQVGIIGLGLMGGSMGLALRETRMFKNILGYDINSLHVQQALSLSLVDEGVDFSEIEACDVIFLAISPEEVLHLVHKFKNLPPHATIIDLSGTKRRILSTIPSSLRKNFIAAHPMCGTEFYGPKAAVSGLYKNKIVLLMDLEENGELQIALSREIFLAIGMQIIKLDSRDHDKYVAFISHLPHIISFALANTALSQEKKEMVLALVGGGFKDMSRISKSSPSVWKDIFKHNSDFVLQALGVFENEIKLAREFMEKGDFDGLSNWMKKANELHNFL